jgi:hypothetical protein
LEAADINSGLIMETVTRVSYCSVPSALKRLKALLEGV